MKEKNILEKILECCSEMKNGSVIDALSVLSCGCTAWNKNCSMHVHSLINAIDVPILIHRKINKDISVLKANKAALEFYEFSDSEIKGKTPEELHSNVKQYMSNYSDWTEEQNDRKVLAGRGSKLGKTKVPMSLKEHPASVDFVGDWYLISNYYEIREKEYILTRFSRTKNTP